MTRTEREARRDADFAAKAIGADLKPSSVPTPMSAEATFNIAAAKEAEGNLGDAVRIYRLAARNGSGKAALRLAEIYDKGVVSVRPEHCEALLWYQRARDLGEQVPAFEAAQAGIAQQCEAELEARSREAAIKAKEDAIKRAEAMKGAQRDAKAPVVAAATEAEAMYQQALAMERDGKVADAVRIYRRTARANHGKAALRLGDIFNCGVPGVPRDYAESLQWYVTARNLGEIVTPPRSC